MSDSAQFLLWLFGIPAAVGVCLLLVPIAEWAVWQAGSAAAHCQSKLFGWRMHVTQSSLRQQDDQAFSEWLASKTGEDLGGAVDGRLLEAQKQAEAIRILIEEELPKAVLRCVDTHRAMAYATGASHMVEVAYEPECYQLRAGAVWLLSHTVRLLASYPLRLDDARLLHNSILLRKRALPTCRRCPYIQLPTHELPRLCPTAQLLQVRVSEHEKIR